MSACDTRAVKVAKHLAAGRPGDIAPDHVAGNTAPTVHEPLFDGTLVFVRLTFHGPGRPPSAIQLADIQVAVAYAERAVVPIHAYASAYGPNHVDVSADVLEFDAQLSGDAFTGAQFESWVDQCATIARANGVRNPCIVILHNRDLPNSPAFTGQRNSFHSITGTVTPYCYCLVFGEGLTVADNNHTIDGRARQKVYAHVLSHEIAEMVVDPRADFNNPEVCDACAGNCDVSLFVLFDGDGNYLGGTDDPADSTGFAFFINPIVSATAPQGPDQCVVPGTDVMNACVYPPPEPTMTDVELSHFAGQNWLITPAALAVGEAAPTRSEQRWLLVLSGVVLADVQGSSADWARQTVRFLPDLLGPLNFAIARYGVPTPTPTTPGQFFTPRFQVDQWAPFAGPSSVFDAHESIDAGFAVDVWRPAPFATFTDPAGVAVHNVFTGVRVDVAVRDSDAWLYRLGYNVTLEGRIVFQPDVIG